MATLDPATTHDGIMLRMGGVHEEDDVIFTLVFLELLVLSYKFFLVFGRGFAGDELGFLEDKVQAMQDGGHAAQGLSLIHI